MNCTRMNRRTQNLVLSGALIFVSFFLSPASADVLYNVTINGIVEGNQIPAPPLGDVMPGETVTLSFQVDSGEFVNSMNFPTRGYSIDQSSFLLEFSGGISIGLQSPFPAGETPYFVIRNNDPAVDGFFVATSLDFPTGVPLNQPAILDPFFVNNFSVTYEGDTLSSLDIEDAEGSYDFAGLTVFNWTIDDGPFNPGIFIFSDLTITKVPEPVAVVPLVGVCLLALRRKK